MEFEFAESHFPLQEEDVILYFKEDVELDLPNEEQLHKWIDTIATQENCELNQLNYIFCTDQYLHQLNVEYLDHDTLTDVISFPYAKPPQVQGDIFISIDRIQENATKFAVTFEQELLRVMIHGFLHFCGYGDKTPTEAERMRAKENEALKHWQAIKKVT